MYGCQPKHSEPQEKLTEEKWKADSVAYVGRLAKWREDSIRIDSIARTINTDSLYRIYRAMLQSEDPGALRQPAMCEETRLGARYGTLPAEVATTRMRDTLYGPNDEPRLTEMRRRLSQERRFVTIVPALCGGLGPRAPQQIGGTYLSATAGPPIPPHKP